MNWVWLNGERLGIGDRQKAVCFSLNVIIIHLTISFILASYRCVLWMKLITITYLIKLWIAQFIIRLHFGIRLEPIHWRWHRIRQMGKFAPLPGCYFVAAVIPIAATFRNDWFIQHKSVDGDYFLGERQRQVARRRWGSNDWPVEENHMLYLSFSSL